MVHYVISVFVRAILIFLVLTSTLTYPPPGLGEPRLKPGQAVEPDRYAVKLVHKGIEHIVFCIR